MQTEPAQLVPLSHLQRLSVGVKRSVQSGSAKSRIQDSKGLGTLGALGLCPKSILLCYTIG